MSEKIVVPSVGESVTEVTIAKIYHKVGDGVKVDEPLFVMETDKATQEVYASHTGVLTEIAVKEGDVVKVGDLLGSIEPGKEASAPTPAPKPVVDEPKKVVIAGGVRKQPEEFFVEKKVEPKPVVEGKVTRVKMTKLRKVIAQKLVEVKNQTAMLTTFNEVDMSAVMAVREKEQENFQKKHGVKLGFMSFFAKACVAALQEYPGINGRIEGDELVYPNYYDIGIAVGTEKGLMVPVLRDADKMSYADIEKALKGYAEKARAGTISVDEMKGGTFTITNGGVYGSLLSTPILNPPQSGILGMHNIVKRAVVVDDQIVIRPMMYLALSYDHRIVDGKESIGFLVHMKKNLEDPARFLLDL